MPMVHKFSSAANAAASVYQVSQVSVSQVSHQFMS